MKQRSLLKIIEENWESISSKKKNGYLLKDIFLDLELHYGIKRAYTTWYTTLKNFEKKQGLEETQTNKKEKPIEKNNVPERKKATWNPSSNKGENPILEALKKNNNS